VGHFLERIKEANAGGVFQWGQDQMDDQENVPEYELDYKG
jgi:hypothetical protein